MRNIIVVFVLSFLVYTSVLGDNRTYPTSGTVYKKTKGISAKHVTQASGKDAEIEAAYFVCIQRNPKTDRYADSWLVYRQCWDVNKATWDAIDICDWFTLKDVQINDQKTRPTEAIFEAERSEDAKKIKEFKKCND